ncbi:hypothetical protein H6P87_01260 [Rickettsia tillamookensis]|uniref:Lipoprotein n=1 Tax=Rickettsia tillamookensis TaxID=2761623 RepID=A0A9E6MIM7_9RICK|nr:hypothetical protein [Rickettsia tillamookensis]QQV75696.1 hypothetical protein H6P87_01260 [Rickettsia tillamookensis]
MKISLIILTLISTSLIGCTTVEHNKVSKKSKYTQEEEKLIAELLYNASDEMLMEYVKAVSNYDAVKNLSSASNQEKQRLYNIMESSLTKILTEKNTARPVCNHQQTLKDYFFIEREVNKARISNPNSNPKLLGDAILFDMSTHRAACIMRLSFVTIVHSKN